MEIKRITGFKRKLIQMEELEDIEKQIGPISGWQKIIMLALIVLAGLYEIKIGI